MAMFEQTPLDEAVGTLDNVHDPPTSRNRLRPEASAKEACAQCGTTNATPAMMAKAKKTTSSVKPSSSKTTSPSSSSSRRDSTRRESRDEAGMAMRRSTSGHAVGAVGGGDRIHDATVGMRGGGEGGRTARAAGPVKGLAAFGSYNSLTSIATGAMSTPSREVSPRPEPPSWVYASHGAQVAAAKRSAEGSAAATVARGRAEAGGRSSRGNSPSTAQGVGGMASGSKGSQLGGSGSGGHSKSGSSAAAAAARDPGYRVLQWSDLKHLTYMTAGAMCEIYSAELDGVKVAVKVPRKDCEEPAVAEHDLEVELDVLKRVNHKHIIALVGAGLREERPHRFLVLEFLELGTLADKLDGGSKTDGAKESTFLRRQKRTKRYQDFYMVTMLERSLELAMALEHLHHSMADTFVVHRDLKPDNVGFKADGTLKLFDFGLARVVKRRNRVNARYEMTGETGSMRYMAPEVVESLPYNEKVDVYAFGLLLWEMLEDRRVFDGMGVSDFYERVVNAGARPNLDPAWPQDLRKLISQCWHADVDRRPNFKVIAERLRELYSAEKRSGKLSLSALNLNEDEHPKLKRASSPDIPRSATTTNIVSPYRRGGPSSQAEIGEKRGLLRRSFSKIGRILKPSSSRGLKATLVHTAPEAQSRPPLAKGRPVPHPAGRSSPVEGGVRGRSGQSNGLADSREEAVYGEGKAEAKGGRYERGSRGSRSGLPRRALSDGILVPQEKKT